MSDLIKRTDAIKVIDRMKHRLIGNGCTYEFMRQMIEELPTIEPKRGEWIEQEDCWQCPVCGDEYVLEVGVKPIDARMNFCPNCGARMKGADDEI